MYCIFVKGAHEKTGVAVALPLSINNTKEEGSMFLVMLWAATMFRINRSTLMLMLFYKQPELGCCLDR